MWSRSPSHRADSQFHARLMGGSDRSPAMPLTVPPLRTDVINLGTHCALDVSLIHDLHEARWPRFAQNRGSLERLTAFGDVHACSSSILQHPGTRKVWFVLRRHAYSPERGQGQTPQELGMSSSPYRNFNSERLRVAEHSLPTSVRIESRRCEQVVGGPQVTRMNIALTIRENDIENAPEMRAPGDYPACGS